MSRDRRKNGEAENGFPFFIFMKEQHHLFLAMR